MTLLKSAHAQVKAAGPDDGLAEGEYRALVSVFGNVDLYGDVVEPGAFTNTLAEWAAKGDPIPVYWSHRMDDPDYNVGHVLEATETEKGLEVRVQLDLDNPKSAQVYRLLKGRRVTQHSFAYDIVDAGWETRDGVEVFSLKELKLHEVGPTPIGANPETELLGVKSALASVDHLTEGVKAGRPLSDGNKEALREALKSLEDSAAHIKDALPDEAGDDQDEASGAGPADDETPDGAPDVEPSRSTSAKSLATLQLLALSEGERGSHHG